ncbi:hypothetical protein [Pseudopelagicola sp. nBUS_19]|uniref:hypothetical protein n=1 Tax=Pseudopelagicola sp. nBUS_19 TaxID=3395316 RepID=UPI003EBF3101
MKKKPFQQQDQAARFTILEAGHGRIQTKRFHNGGVDSSSRAKNFTHEERAVCSFDGLYDLITELSKSPCKVVVAGSVKEEFLRQEHIRRLANPRDGEAATLSDQGCAWLHFDVDDVVRPDHLSWQNPQALAEWTWGTISRKLPALKGVSVVWQASSSAATDGKEHLAKFHFYCLADRPLLKHEREHLFEVVGSDKSLARIAQSNYIANPIFDGVRDPLEGLPRIGVLREQKEIVDTGSIAFPNVAKRSQKKATKGKPSKPFQCEANPSHSKTITSKRGEAQLSKACARLADGKHGNTTIYNESLLIGGFVGAGEINETEAFGRLLNAARNTGHDRYEEAVRNGIRDGVARPINGAKPADAPASFHPPRSISRDLAIAMHSKTIEEWGTKAMAFLSKQREGKASKRWASPPQVVLSGAQGVGKTAAIVGRDGHSGFLHYTNGLVSLVLLPDHEKVAEAYADYHNNASVTAPPAIVLKGRNRPDSAAHSASTKMCHAYPTASKISELGFSIRSALCKKCPFQMECGYLRQEAEIKAHLSAKAGLVIFAPHEYGHLPLPAEAEPDLTIFDERPRDFGVEDVHVSLVELAEDLMPPVKNNTARDDEVMDSLVAQDKAISPVKRALLSMAGSNEGFCLKLLRESGLTTELLKAAIRDLEELKTGNINRALKPLFSCKEDPIDETQLITIGQRLKDSTASHARRLQILCECLLADMKNGLVTSSAVFTQQDRTRPSKHQAGFCAVRLRKLKNINVRPFLYVDGTADPDLSRRLFGSDMEAHHYPVERNAKVTQVIGCNFAKRRLSVEAQDKQKLTDKIILENETLRGFVNDVIARHPEAAVFGTKAVISSLDIDQTGKAGHFGKLRGQNKWEQFDQAIVIGREQPGYLDVERIARAFASAAGEDFLSGDYVKQSRGIRMRRRAHAVDVLVHRDPWGDRILRQIREAEIEQAMDRIRLIHNKVPKEVFLLTPVVANVTVDRIIEWRDFKRGGSNIERAIAKHGVLFLSPTDCARYMSDIWRSKQAAGTDPSRAKLMSKEPCRDILYGEFDGKSPPILVEFRPAIEAGRTARRRKALVFAPAHEARQKLEQFFPVSEFRYCELSDALKITEIDNQKATEEMSS